MISRGAASVPGERWRGLVGVKGKGGRESVLLDSLEGKDAAEPYRYITQTPTINSSSDQNVRALIEKTCFK